MLDKDGRTRGAATPAGQAALLLVESLLHELVALGLLPIERATTVVEIAADTAAEIAFVQSADHEDHDPVGDLLRAIACTLSQDAGEQDAVEHS